MNSALNTVRPDLLSKNEYNNELTGNGLPAVDFPESNHPVYLTDSKNASYGDECTYKITLIDEKGLSSSVIVLNNSRQLKPVKINVDNEQILNFIEEEGSERYEEATTMKLDLVTAMEKELIVESMIKSLGFSDCVVSISTSSENVNVFINSDELNYDTALQIYNMLKNETGIVAGHIIIMPVYSES